MNTTALPLTAARGSVRRILLTIHLWIGLMFGIPLVLIGLTGSILVFEGELRSLFLPQVQATHGAARPLDDILAAARAAAPNGSRPMFLAVPEDSGKMASVRFAMPGAAPGPGGLQIQVDPVSLKTFAANPSSDKSFRLIHMFHAQFIAGPEARRIVGAFGIAMCLLGISGLIMHWPRWSRWKAAFTVDKTARGARLFRELHGAIGFWFWLVFMSVSISSVYLAYPQTMGNAVRSVFPARDLRLTAVAPVVPIEGAHPIGLDDIVASASAAVPDASLRFVALPPRPDQPIRVNMGQPGYSHGMPMISVFVDPWAKRVIEVRDPRDYTLGETILAWQHAIHAGDGFGWPWRILVFISGLLPSVFFGTGLTLWVLQQRQASLAKPD